jgi:hypothetical protein
MLSNISEEDILLVLLNKLTWAESSVQWLLTPSQSGGSRASTLQPSMWSTDVDYFVSVDRRVNRGVDFSPNFMALQDWMHI